MGNPISKVREEATEADNTKKMEMQQRMNILEKMIESKLQNETTKILAGEPNDQEIHTGTVVSLHKQINIKESQKESQKISDAIGDFFSGEWLGGLQEVIELGAEAVLGNATMGEYESTDMLIVWTNNALLRCDAYYYRWNFVTDGVIDQAEGVVGVLLVQRVIDITQTDPQVLLWAITQQATRAKMTKEETEKMIDSAMEMMDKVVEIQKKVVEIEKDMK